MNASKKDFYDHLDGKPVGKAVDAETQEMLELLREVEDLPTPDPGIDYWNNFNAEFQERLAKTEKPRFWQIRWLVPAFATVALVLFAALYLPFWQQEPAQTGPLSLADLSNESLALLEQIYIPEDGDYYLVQDNSAIDLDEDALFESFETLYDDLDYSLDGLEADQLESIWNREG
jgi:hypothetical protein